MVKQIDNYWANAFEIGINPMAMINANNISAWMVMNQFGDVVAGPGAARDNIMPMSIANINKGNCYFRHITFTIST